MHEYCSPMAHTDALVALRLSDAGCEAVACTGCQAGMILRKEKKPVRIDVVLQGALVEALCEPLQCLRALDVMSEGKVGYEHM